MVLAICLKNKVNLNIYLIPYTINLIFRIIGLHMKGRTIQNLKENIEGTFAIL